MKQKFFRYLGLQLKRGKRHLPSVLTVTLLLLIATGLLGSLLFDVNTGGQQQEKIEIGIVGDVSNAFLKAGMYALQNMDSSRFAVTFTEMDEAEAERQLRAGTIHAYVRIPDGFVQSVSRGENVPLRYVSTDGAVGIGTMMTSEIAGSVSTLLLQSENAIFGMQRYAAAHGYSGDIGALGDQLCEKYMEQVLRREQLYQLDLTGITEGLSMAGYLSCGILVLFLMLWGISLSPLFSGRDMALSRMLKSRGFPLRGMVLAEYLSYFLLMLLCLGCAGIAAGVFLWKTGLRPPEWDGTRAGDFLLLFVRGIPAAAMICALQFLLYELVSGAVNGILLQFLSAVVLGYVSGCFYPRSFFPDAVRRIGGVLPTGVAMDYLGSCLRGEPSLWLAAGTAAYLAVFLTLACAVRRSSAG